MAGGGGGRQAEGLGMPRHAMGQSLCKNKKQSKMSNTIGRREQGQNAYVLWIDGSTHTTVPHTMVSHCVW